MNVNDAIFAHDDAQDKKKILNRITNSRWNFIRRNWTKSRKHALLSKRLIRSGIPDTFRGEVWSYSLGSSDLLYRLPYQYFEYVNKAEVVTPQQALQQIDLDITRTFPSHRLYQTYEGIQRLRRVLRAFTVYNPAVSYCQALNFLAGLLLIYMEEDLAFWSLVQMVCSTTKKGMNISDYYTEPLFGLKRDIRTLYYLMKRHTAKALALLNALQIELDWICAEWFLCSFATTLPMPITLRIWDILLNEGKKIFFRVSLAMFKVFEQRVPKHCTFETIINYFKRDVKVDRASLNILLHTAFHGIGRLKRSRIFYLEKKAADDVMNAMKLEAQRRLQAQQVRDSSPKSGTQNDNVQETNADNRCSFTLNKSPSIIAIIPSLHGLVSRDNSCSSQEDFTNRQYVSFVRDIECSFRAAD